MQSILTALLEATNNCYLNIDKLNKDLDEVQKWLKSKKTKYMIIGSHYRLRHLNGDLNVIVNSQQLTRVTNYS